MKKITVLLAICGMFLTSCAPKSEIIPLAQIDKTLQTTIKQKNDSLIEGLKTSNIKIYRALGTEDFNEHLQARAFNVAMMFRRWYVDGSYKVYDAHLVKNSKDMGELKFSNENLGYNYLSVNKGGETYVSMLKMLTPEQDYLLICCYSNTGNNQWKLNKLEMTPIGRYGLTPLEMYRSAVASEKKGKVLDAYYMSRMVLDWAKSLEQMKTAISFTQKEDAEKLKEEMKEQLNDKYKFPIVMKGLSDKPVITDISIKLTDKGVFPCVIYESTLGDDEMAMEREYAQLREVAPELFPDMDFDKQYVVYHVTYHQKGYYGRTVNEKDYFYKRY
nr:hypothetical protein [uncultured Flavobacterium sp.]